MADIFAGKHKGFLSKLNIAYAMANLMRDTPLDKISVADICEEAGITRATFYYHFASKYEVAQWHWDCFVRPNIQAMGRTMSYRESNLRILEHMREFASFYKPSCESQQPEGLLTYSRRTNIDIIEDLLRGSRGLTISPDLQFEIAYMSSAETAMIYDWLESGAQLSPLKMSSYLDQAAPRSIYRHIDI